MTQFIKEKSLFEPPKSSSRFAAANLLFVACGLTRRNALAGFFKLCKN